MTTPPAHIASADESHDRAEPVVELDAEPDSARLGEVITVTGSVSDGDDDGSWAFDVPAFVQRLDQNGSVLRIECQDVGQDAVTVTYTDGVETGQDSVIVTCTAGPPTTEAPPSTTSESTASASDTPSGSATPSPSTTSAPTATSATSASTPASTSAESPSATPDDPLRKKVDDAERQLERGVVSYRPPSEMREGESTDFVVRVQRESTPTDPEDVPGEGPVIERPIEVGTPMSARLVGEDFDIRPAEALPRVLGSTRPAEWSWTITPKSSGKKELRLELAVLLEENSATPIAIRTYTETIDVRVHLIHTGVRLAKSATGVLGATGLTLAALAGAALSWWRRHRSPKAAAGATSQMAPEAGHVTRNRRPPARRAKRRQKKQR